MALRVKQSNSRPLKWGRARCRGAAGSGVHLNGHRMAAVPKERPLVEFASQLSSTGSIYGSYDSTEKLLIKMLPSDRVRKRCLVPPGKPVRERRPRVGRLRV